jgi:hypothetical protein
MGISSAHLAQNAFGAKTLDKPDKAGGINDRLESRLASFKTTKLRDGMGSLPTAATVDKSSHAADTCSTATAALKAVPARKEGRMGAGPSRIAKPAERVLVIYLIYMFVLCMPDMQP